MWTSRRIRSGFGVVAWVACAALVLAGCTSLSGADRTDDGRSGDGGAGDDAPSIYATTGYLADAVENIAPDAEVTTMVGPGGDPHTYQPSTRDIETIQSADMVFWNGLYLEAQMIDLLGSLGDAQLAVGEQLPTEMLLEWPEAEEGSDQVHDPHVWNSPGAWSLVVDLVSEAMVEVNPDKADEYRANAAGYREEIAATDERVAEILAAVPEPRTVVTGHDAFAYFGAAYDLDVHATDFVSSEAALSAHELSALADLVVDNEISVIFGDNQANPQAITSLREAVLARGWNVEIADADLFADSLGAEPGVDTYLGVLEHNAATIAGALGDEE